MHQDKNRRQPPAAEPSDKDNVGGQSPAHWQGEPLPTGEGGQTQDVGFDRRGAGRARQYGRAGAHGQRYNEQERRPPRGQTPPGDVLLDAVLDVFRQTGVDISRVAVKVDDGVIHLDGSVADLDEKNLLEQMAAKCPGVIEVKSNLDPAPSPSDDAAV